MSTTRVRLATVVAVLAAAFALSATPAGAWVFQDAQGHFYGLNLKAGVSPSSIGGGLHIPGYSPAHYQPRNDATRFDSVGNLTYQSQNGPVMHGATFYAFFWIPPSETDMFSPTDTATTHPTQDLIAQWMQGVAADSGKNSNSFAVAQQYTDASGANEAYSVAFGGSLVDTNVFPKSACPGGQDPNGVLTNCLADSQVRSELQSFVSSHGLPTGANAIYYVFTPQDTAVCNQEGNMSPCSTKEFCGYHSDTANSNGGAPSTLTAIPPGDILYAAIPFFVNSPQGIKGCQAITRTPFSRRTTTQPTSS